MVFFVSLSITVIRCYLANIPYHARSSCSQTWNATTLTPLTFALNSTAYVYLARNLLSPLIYLLACTLRRSFLLVFCPQFVLPEYVAHGFLALIFLLSGQWMALALNLPLVAYNVRK